MASLLHDIAKPLCRENKGDHDRFLYHDIKGAELTNTILKRMKYKNDYILPIVSCVRNHMNAHNLPKMKDEAKIRRFIGKKYFKYIREVALYDTMGTLNEDCPIPAFSILVDTILKYETKYHEILPKRIITGDSLIEIGLKPCFAFNDALEKAYDQQLRGEENKEKLLNFAKESIIIK